eukprot:m51a1_g10485 putative 1,4-alpha-glucan-branching enzyme (710) ;mRNA; f:46907-49943
MAEVESTRATAANENKTEPENRWLKAGDGTGIIAWDSWLEPHAQTLRDRYSRVQELTRWAVEREGSLLKFARSYARWGLHRAVDPATGRRGVSYREWAPGAINASLIGEFNDWDRSRARCTRDEYGHWSVFLPDGPHGEPAIPHQSLFKVSFELRPGHWEDRVPAWATRVVQGDVNVDPVFVGQWWCPDKPYEWKHPVPKRPRALKIYECHVGMATEKYGVGTYSEFMRDVVPYIAAGGYNAVQIMAVMEHAYYASFGYQITSFFAASSRFGTPDELKALIDECHGRGITVLLDVVHSHASNNVYDGLNGFDGTDHHYFHAPPKGRHELWDSRLFNYGNWETLRFLLSNVAWYMDEYRFDGFRFDGVTSMLYVHHGMGDNNFDYPHFYGAAVDSDALAYLTLANTVIHEINREAVSIAEDVSGFPGLCRPVPEGGVGFDYRLAMACPDLWVNIMKKVHRDEDWDMDQISNTLANRRWMEPCIAYAESHDQALVGDKTIAFWLMDKEMYDWMSKALPLTPIIERGMALHKMIRLLTCGLGGEGYLTFMGNEFGHPEWIDFPRPGNNASYHYARRQWSLVKDHNLRYHQMGDFDAAMLHLEEQVHWLSAGNAYVSLRHGLDKVIVFERAGAVFVFNFHPTLSLPSYRVPCSTPGRYRLALCSDDLAFGGQGRVDTSVPAQTERYQVYGCFDYSLMIYAPSRTALVFVRETQ